MDNFRYTVSNQRSLHATANLYQRQRSQVHSQYKYIDKVTPDAVDSKMKGLLKH